MGSRGPRQELTNVRDAVSSFVGREDDVAALSARFEDGRLVTVLGPGGMGKTRLALRFASEHADTYATHGGGAWFCDLSPAQSAGDVVAIVAATLGITLAGLDTDAASTDRVGRAIAARGRVLVVLDNFEQLTAAAAATVGLWHRMARSARFLITSRVPLDLAGEEIWPLAPLAREDAIDLFVRRARDRQPMLETDRERDVIGEIVDRVDRMPLAIELAATRTSVLSLTQLRDRLERPLELLRGPREVARHASIRQVVLDSLALCQPAHRALFTACGVMRNGFTLDAAEAIFGELVMPRDEVLDALSALARSSLLRVQHEPADVARYAFFETLRDVAEEQLASDPTREALVARHASYYAALCESHEVSERDLDNALAAHRVSGAVDMLHIALGLEPLLSTRGLSRLRARLLDEALDALAPDAVDGKQRADAHLSRGFARRELGQAQLARDDFERGLTLARDAHDVGLCAVATMRLGGIDDLVGDTPAARVRMSEALDLLARTPRDATRSLREAEAHQRLGHAHRREGALDPARAAIHEAIDRYRVLAHDEGLASSLYELAVIEMFAGRQTEAFARFDEGLAIAEHGGVRVMMGALKTARGCLLQDVGRLAEALEHHAEAARIFEELGSRYREGSALYYLATTFFERGDVSEALAVLSRAEERVADVGAPRYEALLASCTAAARAAVGRFDAAETAMTRAELAAARVENEPALAGTLAIHRATLALRRDAAIDRGPARAEAAAIVARHPSDDSRFAARLLSALATEPRPSEHENALVVRAGGAAFSAPGSGAFVTIPERSPLRRILETLALRRIGAPGEVLTIDDVIRVGWPGEKIGTEAALNRAYVALASLRKLGLRAILLKSGGGYSLSRAVVVRIEDGAD